MGELTPLVICIDVEPDDRNVHPSARPRWVGFEAMLPQMRRFRLQLAKATGAAVHFTWLFRLDRQIEHVYGRPDWGLDQYRREIEELGAHGDAIGVHPHSWRWDEADGTWIADHGDPAWVEDCVRLSLDSFRKSTGRCARVFKHGDEFLSNAVVGLIESMGVCCDLTIAPGNPPTLRMLAEERSTGSLPDYRDLPRVPYRPSPRDFRRPGIRRRRRLWHMPLTTGLAVNPYAGDKIAKNQHLLIGAPLVVNRQILDDYWRAFPVSVIFAVARTDVFLDPFNAEQFRGFMHYLADHPRREQLILATPQEAARNYRRRLQAQGLDQRAVARYVMSTRYLKSTTEPGTVAFTRPGTPGPSDQPAVSLLHVDGRRPERESDPAKIRGLEETVWTLQERLETIEGSRWWALRRRLLQLRSLLHLKLSRGHGRGLLRRFLRVLFAPGRMNLRWAAKTACKQWYLLLEEEAVVILTGQSAELNSSLAAASASYSLWLGLHAPRPDDLALYRDHLLLLAHRPRISILLPVFDPPPHWLRQAVESVIAQVYPEWELCIADDASTSPQVRQVIAELAGRDPRIRVVRRARNGHISAASNSALALASGEFCALLDHDDLLAPDALYHNVVALNRQRDLDILYSDEDKIDSQNRRCAPNFKPEWSPDTLLSGNYVCHLLVARTALIREVGGFREGFEGAQDFDLVLRLSERTQRIHHIPRVLYHWRMHAHSTAQASSAKPYAYRAGVRAIEESLARRGEVGQVTQVPGAAGFYNVRYVLRSDCQTSIIIPTRDQAQVLEACLASLFERTRHQFFQVLVVDNGSRQLGTFDLFYRYRDRYPGRFSVLRDDGEFNFSRLVNAGAKATQGSFLLFLNNDVEAIKPDWLAAMLEQTQRPSIGCVGARLLYPDRTIQHAGVVLGGGQMPAHVFRHADRDAHGYGNRLQTVTNYSAVTGACLLVRRSVFEQVGGFDEAFAIDYNDIDFCLRVREAGYHNVFIPQATLLHHELLSRGSSQRTAESSRRFEMETKRFQARWAPYVASDPCISPHLKLHNGDLRVA